MADTERTDELRAKRLQKGTWAFVTAADASASIAVIQEFPELLTDPAARSAKVDVERLRLHVHPAVARHVESQLKLLREAQQVGIERALFDRMIREFKATMDTASVILARFLASGEPALLDEAVDHWRPVVAHKYLTVIGATPQRQALRRAATALVHLFRRDGRPEALDEAVSLLDRAAGLAVRNDDDLAGFRCQHGEALSLRYRLRGDPADRQRAGDMYRTAADASLPDSPARRVAAEGLRSLDVRGPQQERLS
jgi:hypothetical protein